MKARKCPYCGKRISYITIFDEKSVSEHICPRCGKESKIVVKKNIFVSFLIAVVISAVIAVMWIGLGYINHPIGVLFVATPLVISYLLSPNFIRVLPFKKYKKSMEATKAAREYGSEMKFKENYGNTINDTAPASSVIDNSNDFAINKDLFASIKSNRKKPEINDGDSTKIASGSTVVVERPKKENYVPIIENSREAHASSSENVPLQKIHKERPHYEQPKPFLNYQEDEIEKRNFEHSDNERRKRQEGSRYSANRRF